MVTAVGWPISGVQLSMKRSNDWRSEKASAKTRLRNTPAAAPALIRVRSMGSDDLSRPRGLRSDYHRTALLGVCSMAHCLLGVIREPPEKPHRSRTARSASSAHGSFERHTRLVQRWRALHEP